jgi:hypothetical protein
MPYDGLNLCSWRGGDGMRLQRSRRQGSRWEQENRHRFEAGPRTRPLPALSGRALRR